MAAAEMSNVECLTPTLTTSTIQRTTMEPESESELNNALKEVKYLNVSSTQGVSSEFQPKVYPTLRLRLLHSNALDYKESNNSGTLRQAVTQPRRIVSESSNGSDNSIYWLDTQPNSLINANVINPKQSQQMQRNSAKHLPEHRITFDQWLLAKRKSEVLHRRQARREKLHQSQLRQLRKQIAEQSYADWLQLKRLTRQPLKVPRLTRTVSVPEQTQRCLQQWEERKQYELLQRREQRQREKEMQQLDNQLRGQLSQLAWQRWLTQLKVKSKHRCQVEKLRKPKLTAARVRAVGGGFRMQSPMPLQQRCKLQKQLASFYFHVPLSKAQRRLQWRNKL